jgi:hypothetical protein
VASPKTITPVNAPNRGRLNTFRFIKSSLSIARFFIKKVRDPRRPNEQEVIRKTSMLGKERKNEGNY